MRAEDVKRGEVVHYHPVIGLPDYVPVRIVDEPYELGSGKIICKAIGVRDGKRYYPSIDALEVQP